MIRSYAPAPSNGLPLKTALREVISIRRTRALSTQAPQITNIHSQLTVRQNGTRENIASFTERSLLSVNMELVVCQTGKQSGQLRDTLPALSTFHQFSLK